MSWDFWSFYWSFPTNNFWTTSPLKALSILGLCLANTETETFGATGCVSWGSGCSYSRQFLYSRISQLLFSWVPHCSLWRLPEPTGRHGLGIGKVCASRINPNTVDKCPAPCASGGWFLRGLGGNEFNQTPTIGFLPSLSQSQSPCPLRAAFWYHPTPTKIPLLISLPQALLMWEPELRHMRREISNFLKFYVKAVWVLTKN